MEKEAEITRLTSDQFEALRALRGLHDSASARALRMVMVGGASVLGAASIVGIKPQALRTTIAASELAIKRAKALCDGLGSA